MKKNMSSLLAILLAMLAALSIAGCGGGGDNGGGGGADQYVPICSFNNQKATIYTDYPTIVSLSQDSTGVITGTAYDKGIDQAITGKIQSNEYNLGFYLIENGKTYSVALTGTVVNSGGVCVSADGTYTKKEGENIVASGTFNQLRGNYASALPTYDGKIKGFRMKNISGLASQKLSIDSASSASNLVFGAFNSGTIVAGWASETNVQLTWKGTYSGQAAIFNFNGTDAGDGTAAGTTSVISDANTSTTLASSLASSISLLAPITLNGAIVLETISEAYSPLPPASNVQVHDMTFTQVGTAITGTDAGGTTSSGNFVAGWGPITSGIIDQTTGEITFSFEALVCGGGNSTITLSGVTDGTNGSGTITFTAGPGACELPNGTWSMGPGVVPTISIAKDWTFVFQAAITAKAVLTQSAGSPDDLVSSSSGTATIISTEYPMTVSGALTNTDANPTTKPVHLVFTANVTGCGTLTVTADGTATESTMDFTWTSSATIAGAGCVNSTPASGWAVSP